MARRFVAPWAAASASFIPPAPIRELRDLTRYRKSLVQERGREVNRVQKVLETANIKLSSVATDVLGKSGRDMLAALMEGTTDAEILAELAPAVIAEAASAITAGFRWSCPGPSSTLTQTSSGSYHLSGRDLGAAATGDRATPLPF